jgi:SAM-dependent methyltransferase
MTRAQADAQVCGLVPEAHDPKFVSQHWSAYAFARPLVAGKRVLEVGFGEGYGANFLAAAAAEVIGVDIAPGNIDRAAAKYPRANLRFQRIADQHLPFPNAAFDVVCSFQVIEHIPEPNLPQYLAEIARVLAPTGVFAVSTLNLAHAMKPGQPYQKLIYHEKEFTAPELEALLKRVFPSVELYGLHLTWKHRCYQRLKKWGLNRVGPPALNPIARFYQHVAPNDFTVTRDVSRAALDLFALCRK